MITPAEYNLEIIEGTSFRLECQLVDDAGDPINIEEYEFKMQIRDNVGASSIIFDLNQGNGIEMIEPAEGQFIIYINSDDTINKNFLLGVYDLEVRDNEQCRYIYLTGSVYYRQKIIES